jgi:hypothetical protein
MVIREERQTRETVFLDGMHAKILPVLVLVYDTNTDTIIIL